MSNDSSQLRYVVLHHEGFGNPHLDLMFESSPGSLLKTWRCPEFPIHAGHELTELSEHRRDYLTYEGAVSGNRGTVRRVLEGALEWTEAKGSPAQITIELLTPQRMLFILRNVPGTARWTVVEASE
jgi:hypothetical protein